MKTTKIVALSVLAVCLGLSGAVLAQQRAVVGTATDVTIKLPEQVNMTSCNIEIQFPNGDKTERQPTAPAFEEKVSFTPMKDGENVITWKGKNRVRGFKSVFACSGEGSVIISAKLATTSSPKQISEELVAPATKSNAIAPENSKPQINAVKPVSLVPDSKLIIYSPDKSVSFTVAPDSIVSTSDISGQVVKFHLAADFTDVKVIPLSRFELKNMLSSDAVKLNKYTSDIQINCSTGESVINGSMGFLIKDGNVSKVAEFGPYGAGFDKGANDLVPSSIFDKICSEAVEKKLIKNESKDSGIISMKLSDSEILRVNIKSIKTAGTGEYPSIQVESVLSSSIPVETAGVRYKSAAATIELFCSDFSGSVLKVILYSGMDKEGNTLKSISYDNFKISESPFMPRGMAVSVCEAASKTGLYKSLASASNMRDLPSGDLMYKNINSSLKPKVCSNIKQLTTHAIPTALRYASVGNTLPYEEIARNGGYEWAKPQMSGNVCKIPVRIKGTYQGNSYAKDFNCTVSMVSMTGGEKFIVNGLTDCF